MNISCAIFAAGSSQLYRERGQRNSAPSLPTWEPCGVIVSTGAGFHSTRHLGREVGEEGM